MEMENFVVANSLDGERPIVVHVKFLSAHGFQKTDENRMWIG
jgi:hypothetical protein